jgi:hypothetical protein
MEQFSWEILINKEKREGFALLLFLPVREL